MSDNLLVTKLNALKSSKNLTSAQWAKLSGVPEATINRILSGATANPSYQTVCDMLTSIDCSMDTLSPITPDEQSDSNSTQRLIDTLENQMARQTRIIMMLVVALAVVIIFIIAVLLVDFFNPTIGFIRYQKFLDSAHDITNTAFSLLSTILQI